MGKVQNWNSSGEWLRKFIRWFQFGDCEERKKDTERDVIKFGWLEMIRCGGER